MTNFLISTMPATGHVTPFLPIATELSSRGHSVAWHTGRGYEAQVRGTGARYFPFVETPDFDQVRVEPDPAARGLAVGVSIMQRLFIDRIGGQVADYRSILEQFPADLILADMCSFGADTLRDAGGPPYATVGINPLVTTDPEIPRFGTGKPHATTTVDRLANQLDHWLARTLFYPRVTERLNEARAARGAPALPRGVQFADRQRSPLLHLMPTTRLFEFPRAHLEPQIRFVGPLLPPVPDDVTLPAWWRDLESRRVVHVTQGTYATHEDALLRPTIEALAGDDVLVVATTPEPDALAPLPANVRISRFIPHGLLLPHVDAMVTNAGYNGVLTALAHGVPLLCAGRSEDKADVSARVAWAGAGIDLGTDRPTPAQLRNGVRDLLTDPRYRRAARRIADDFAAHNGPAEAADLLESAALQVGSR